MAGEVARRSGLGDANRSFSIEEDASAAVTVGLKPTRRCGVGLRLRAAAVVEVCDKGESMAELIVGCWWCGEAAAEWPLWPLDLRAGVGDLGGREILAFNISSKNKSLTKIVCIHFSTIFIR